MGSHIWGSMCLAAEHEWESQQEPDVCEPQTTDHKLTNGQLLE